MDSANSPSGHAKGGSYNPSTSPPLTPPPHPRRPLDNALSTPIKTTQQSTSPQYPRRLTTLVRIDSDIAEVVHNTGNPNDLCEHVNLAAPIINVQLSTAMIKTISSSRQTSIALKLKSSQLALFMQTQIRKQATQAVPALATRVIRLQMV
jgi:hypothetical protein